MSPSDADRERDGIIAPTNLNPKHVEWFVRFQVDQHPFDRVGSWQAGRSLPAIHRTRY